MHVYGEISGRLTPGSTLKGRLKGEERIQGSLTVPIEIFPEEYQGSYDITPGPEAQILATSDKLLTQGIIIEPIPSNYGLITTDGSVITVS